MVWMLRVCIYCERVPMCSCHLDWQTRSRADVTPLAAMTQLTRLVIIGQTLENPDCLSSLSQLQVQPCCDCYCHACLSILLA